MNNTLKSTIAVSALLLTACAGQPEQAHLSYDPTANARVRVYFGVATKFYFNTACEPHGNVLGTSTGSMAVAKPRTLHLANTTIGMPVPDDAYRYYDEYVVKANQPLTITMDSGGTRDVGLGMQLVETKQHTAGSFVPLPGADYEVFAHGENGALRVTLRELSVKDHVVITDLMPPGRAPLCE